MREQHRVSPWRKRDGPALHLIGEHERARWLALRREPARSARPNKHRAVRLAIDFHRLAAFVVQDVSETQEIRKVSRTTGDVPVVAYREGSDGCARLPRLIVSRLLDAECSQSAEGERVVLIYIIKEVFELRGKSGPFSSPREQRLQ